MSTQLLGNVQLVTKQEVEAMLDSTVISEDTIDDKISAVKSDTETAIKGVTTSLNLEREERVAKYAELDDKISDEAEIRDAADKSLASRIKVEADNREQADTQILDTIAEFSEYIEETYPNAFVEKIKGLPIAFLTVTNHDKSLHVGDTIATVDEKFFPKRAADFVMYSEQLDDTGASKTVMLLLRLDNSGNVNVLNMVDVALATNATDTATTIYFTEV